MIKNVEDYQESLSSDFLEVEDYKESRCRTFSRVGHKHGTCCSKYDDEILKFMCKISVHAEDNITIYIKLAL